MWIRFVYFSTVIVLEAVVEVVMWVIECSMWLFFPGSMEPRRASLLDLSPAGRRSRRWRLVVGGVSMLVVVVIALVAIAAFR